MECRRLIQFGRSSFVISLPKKWITSNKLAKGDLIFLEHSQEKLMISPILRKSTTSKRTVITCDRKGSHRIGSEVVSAYLNNFDHIKLIGLDETDVIKELINSLPGLEIIEFGSDRIVAKDLLSQSEVSLDHIFRRVDMLLRSMLTDTLAGEDVFETDKEVNRLSLLTTRVLRSAIDNPTVARTLSLDTLGLVKHWTMIKYLESVGDDVKRISRLLPSDKTDLVDTVKDLAKGYQQVMKTFHTDNLDHARDVAIATKDRSSKLSDLASTYPDHQELLYHLRSLSAQIKNMARLCVDVYEEDEPVALVPPARIGE